MTANDCQSCANMRNLLNMFSSTAPALCWDEYSGLTAGSGVTTAVQVANKQAAALQQQSLLQQQESCVSSDPRSIFSVEWLQ
jgi:hypothetical protein